MEETHQPKQDIENIFLNAIHDIPTHEQFTLRRINMDKVIQQNSSDNALLEIKNIVSNIHRLKYTPTQSEFYAEEMGRLKNTLLQVSTDTLTNLLFVLDTA